MRRERLLDGAAAVLLAGGALAVALPFRREALAKQSVFSLGWDAAQHAAEGLDLFDDLRLLRPLDALGLLLGRHWWGPLWALVSAPFQAAFGPSLPAASLPSLVAFVLAPAAAFFLVRRLFPGGLLSRQPRSLLLVAALFLRSPMLLETSAWPMLESLGGTLALLAWVFFARRPGRHARRAAFLFGAGLFLLKYHFGFFVLGTFLAVVVAEETEDSRRRLGASARALLLRGAGAGILTLAVALAVFRVFLEARGGGSLTARVPSVPNVAWGALVLFVLLVIARRPRLSEAWIGASATFRDLVVFGLLPAAAWCLDPANVRGWYRQIFQPTDVPERNPLVHLAAYWSFLKGDWTTGAGPALLVLFGLLLALALPGERTRRALAIFALWPVLLMSLNAFPAEARFLACLVPALFAAAIAGVSSLAAHLPEKAREPGLAAAAVLLFLVFDTGRMARRARRAHTVSVCIRTRGDRRRERGRRGRAAGRARPRAAARRPSRVAHGPPRSAPLTPRPRAG